MSETIVQPEREALRTLAVEIFDTLRQTTAARRGVSRESFGAGENAAFEILIEIAGRFGLETGTDDAANLSIALPGRLGRRPISPAARIWTRCPKAAISTAPPGWSPGSWPWCGRGSRTPDRGGRSG